MLLLCREVDEGSLHYLGNMMSVVHTKQTSYWWKLIPCVVQLKNSGGGKMFYVLILWGVFNISLTVIRTMLNRFNDL